MAESGWPAARIRVARPTDRLAEVVRFYRDGLGMPEIGGFRDHDGYDGVMLGMPDESVHLEFTTHAAGSPGPAPSRDNLLVLYIEQRSAIDAIVERLAGLGHRPVEPENPYWRGRSVTVADPDGWRVVLFDASGSA